MKAATRISSTGEPIRFLKTGGKKKTTTKVKVKAKKSKVKVKTTGSTFKIGTSLSSKKKKKAKKWKPSFVKRFSGASCKSREWNSETDTDDCAKEAHKIQAHFFEMIDDNCYICSRKYCVAENDPTCPHLTWKIETVTGPGKVYEVIYPNILVMIIVIVVVVVILLCCCCICACIKCCKRTAETVVVIAAAADEV